MPPLPDTSREGLRGRMVAAAAGSGATLIATWLLAGRVGEGPGAGFDAARVLFTQGPWAGLWLASAFGLGAAIRRRLLPDSTAGPALAAALGISALLVVDAALARTGILHMTGGGWVALAPGLLLLVGGLVRSRAHPVAEVLPRPLPLLPPALFWAAFPALAVLLVAACSAPGWLWSTEFGGYDALSYHLQLPKEWLALGRMQGLEHNVYGYLPSYVEGAYEHLFALAGGRGEAAYACQLLHAAITVTAAATALAAVRRRAGDLAGATTAVVILGTPWVVVVGSLAYNEMVTVLGLAAAWLIIEEDGGEGSAGRRGVAIGLVLGAACGAKLTAIGFVAAPVALLLLARGGWRELAAAAVTGLVVLAPWLVANAIDTGNPVFPFAAGTVGHGHWTIDQAEVFHRAHAPSGDLGERFAQAWRELSGGGDAAGARSGSLLPQWSLLPLLALASGGFLVLGRRRRAVAVRLLLGLAVQAVFWILFTHIKARFMLPAAVPAAILVGLAGHEILRERMGAAGRVFLMVLLTVYAAGPVLVFLGEGGGRPAAAVGAFDELSGAADAARLAGTDLSREERRAVLETAPPSYWINHRLAPGARVLFVGEATPLYYDGAVIAYQTTWDRGAMSRVMREAGDDPEAWIRGLQRAGFTHLLVNETMLRIWEDGGWNDPLITADRVLGAAEAFATPVRRWSHGLALYRLGRSGDR